MFEYEYASSLLSINPQNESPMCLTCGYVKIHKNSFSVRILLNIGADVRYISKRFLLRNGIGEFDMDRAQREVSLADSRLSKVLGRKKFKLRIDTFHIDDEAEIMDLSDVDLILEDKWLRKNRAVID